MFVVKEKDRVYFADLALCMWAIDSRITRKDCFDKENLYVYKVKGVKNCVMMGSPRLSEVDAVRYDREVNKKIKESDFTCKDITENVIPAMNEAIVSKCVGRKDYKWKNYFTLAKENRAFSIVDNITYEIDDYEILIGAMRELASASFEETIGQPAIDRILEAARAIKKVQFGEVFPIAIMDTKNQKVRLYNEQGEVICQY